MLDVHRDEHYNRAVLTLAGERVEWAAREVARATLALLDLSTHGGVHPRIGVLDVVPFVPLAGSDIDDAIAARDAFAEWAATDLDLPCFLYGPERSLPDVRRAAFTDFAPDTGPVSPHPTAGACAVGARPVLVAYNLWLARDDLRWPRRSPVRFAPGRSGVRLQVGGAVQVSCNLLAPFDVGPAQLYDRVAGEAAIAKAELVGLVPRDVVRAVPQARWETLDLGEDRTIEARLRQ